MSIKTSLWVWVLALCCFCFSSPAYANYNNFDWGNDITHYKDDILSNYYPGASLDNWQWFPGSGETDGNYSNDSFCQIYNYEGQNILVYGANGKQSCNWWDTGPYSNTQLVFVDYYSELGSVKVDCSNPLNDPSCSGYEKAYLDFMCSTNALYDQSCPGYAQAYYDQQCTLNPLYDQGCAGYAQAYLEQQCSADPLYDQKCPGYAQAYAVQMQQELASQSTTTDDGSSVDDGSTVSDGTSVAEIIAPVEVFTEPEQQSVTESTTETTLTPDEVYTQQSTPAGTPEPTVEKEQQTVAIEEVTQSSETKQEVALEEANSLDLDNMSPSEVIGALSKLGILGNSATNGTGDPTGNNSIEGTGGTISATGQVQVPGTSTESSGSQDGSDNTGVASVEDNGMPSIDQQSQQSDVGTTEGSVNETASYGFGSVNNRPDIGSNGVSQLENEMGTNVNPLFDNPAISGGANVMSDIQEKNYNSLTQRIIRERIQQMIADTKVDNGESSVAEAEDVVNQSIEESIENRMDELMVDANANQAEIVTLMGVNIEFNDYNKRELADADFYGSDDWYKEVEIPQNRRALRNGLAQQILHDKMVDSQYPDEEERNGGND